MLLQTRILRSLTIPLRRQLLFRGLESHLRAVKLTPRERVEEAKINLFRQMHQRLLFESPFHRMIEIGIKAKNMKWVHTPFGDILFRKHEDASFDDKYFDRFNLTAQDHKEN